jgi:hypothetical protein
MAEAIHRTPRNARSKSPFRMARRSRSPFRERQQTGVHSSSRRLANTDGNDHDFDDRFQLHESEINIFQQLCLDKHDESAAIEILLDSSDAIPDLFATSSSAINGLGPRVRLSQKKRADSIEQQATFSTASGSTERESGVSSSIEKGVRSISTESSGSGSRAMSRKKVSSVEVKRTFLDRFFFKLPKLSPQKETDPAGFPSIDRVDGTNEKKLAVGGDPSTSKPEMPDQSLRMQSARRTFDESFRSPQFDGWNDATTGTNNDPNVLTERLDTFSHVSSLSGSRATASIRNARALQRHPSLGIESIQDLRMCLKEMETQLARASNKGQSVSRHKLMKALFTVADSLEDGDELSHLQKGMASNPDNQSDALSRPSMESSMNDFARDEQNSGSSSTDDDEFTQDSSAFGEDDSCDADMANSESSPFNILSFFGVDDQNQRVVGEVLDDLLWGDFVLSGKDNGPKRQRVRTKSIPPNQSHPISHANSRNVTLKVKDYIEPSRRNDPTQAGKGQTSRSWWRNKSSSRPEFCKAKVNDEDEEEREEESSSSSTEFPSYLPSSITVNKKAKQPSTASFPRAPSSCSKVSTQDQPQLVQTESHVGFEMGTLPRRTKLV